VNATSDIVQKLWNLCHVLRDDGISYLQYVTELTYLLFLKMMQETGAEATQLPKGRALGRPHQPRRAGAVELLSGLAAGAGAGQCR
jgi:hypothetical protein